MMSILRGMILMAGLLTASVSFGWAQNDVTQEDLTTYERRLEQERKALAAMEATRDVTREDLAAITRQLLAATQEGVRREEKAAEIERRLAVLQVQDREARNRLMADREGLKEVFIALIASSRKKPPALIAHPDKATDAIQAAIVMRDVAAQLKSRSARLSEQISEYAALIAKVEREQTELDKAEARLSEKRDEIQALAAKKRASYEDISGETDELKTRIQALAKKTESIRSLLAEIAAQAPKPPSRKPSLLQRKGPAEPDSPIAVAVLKRLGLPAIGNIIQKYGDQLPSGRKAEGIKVQTRHAAQVVAPADSTIVWSGPFRSYGKMLILRTGDGYHIVLSGMADIYGALGQTVSAGEPVGQMSDQTDKPSELYMELRKNGTPQDPAQWMSRKAG